MSDWARRAAVSAGAALAAGFWFACAVALHAKPASAAEPGPAAGPASAAGVDSASACEGVRIGSIDIQPRNIYEPLPGGPLVPLYRAANRLHIRTRAHTIREQLLLERGQPYRDERRRETLRVLRSLDYLEPVRVEPRRTGDSVAVTVETRDTWTTSSDFNLERAGGKQYGSYGISERNLLGLGKFASIGYHEDPTGISRSFSFYDPSVLGTRHRLNYAAATGTAGSSDVVSLALPFYALETPRSYGVSWRRWSSVLHLFQGAGEIASLDQRISEIEAWAGLGARRGGTVTRLTGSYLARDRTFGPSRLEPGAPPEFAGGDEQLRLRRAAAELTLWKPRYIEIPGVERMGRVEDYDVGSTLALKLGFAPRALGSTADEGYVRLSGGAGVQTGLGFGLLNVGASTRLRRSPLEVVRRADARWIRPSGPGHALVIGAHGVAGSRVARDFQAVVGGLNGLRAYPVQAVAGRELVRLNVEQRWLVLRNLGDLISIGAAVFSDAARAWGPGAVGTGWFSDAGVGLRLASPRSALGPALRIDVAWPLSPTRDGQRAPVFSFGTSQAF